MATTLSERYFQRIDLSDKHNFFGLGILDFALREAIGKTDDIRVAACSHDAIIAREQGESHCRICHRKAGMERGRINDYLVLRHRQCQGPICYICAEKHPDAFYLAFKKGLDKLKRASIPISVECELGKEKQTANILARYIPLALKEVESDE